MSTETRSTTVHDMFDMSGRVAVVTGGATGIGLAIARALAMNPKVMLFDEPTSALDPELIGSVLQSIKALVNEGMTMIIVTHEIGFAREVSDWILYMDHGAVVEEGPPSMLVAPKTERLQQFLGQILDG